MRIDAHQHYWTMSRSDYGWITEELTVLYRDYLPEHLEDHLRKHNIDGTIVGYSWTFGDGGTSSAANPNHVYGAPGSYVATLTVTDDNGGTDSTTVSVTAVANVAPTAVANSNVTGGQAPLTVHFSSAGSSDPDGGIVSTSWTFGDGNSSSAANPSYTYGTPGTYTATLTVADAEGETDSATISIQVDAIPNEAPTAAAAATPTTQRVGLPIAFSSAGSGDTDGTITSYHWDFADGTSATTANPPTWPTRSPSTTARASPAMRCGPRSSAPASRSVTSSRRWWDCSASASGPRARRTRTRCAAMRSACCAC